MARGAILEIVSSTSKRVYRKLLRVKTDVRGVAIAARYQSSQDMVSKYLLAD
jgi:hypothetical protein